MTPIIYALVFAVVLGFLAMDTQTLGLKITAAIMSAWMFLAAIIAAAKKKDD